MHSPSGAKNIEETETLIDRVEECLEEGAGSEAFALLADEPPADIADVLTELPTEDGSLIFGQLAPEVAADVLSDLGPETVEDLADRSLEDVVKAARQMEPDELADLLEFLDAGQRRSVLAELPREDARAARQLLRYPADTAGGIMTTEFVVLSGDITASSAIEITQKSRESETIAHLFVSDPQDRFLGHLPLHNLVFAHPDRKLRNLMQPQEVAVTPETDQEEVVRMATHYGLDVVPVVDQRDQLVGVITIDDILDAGQQEADEDMYRLAGTSERDPVHASVLRSTRLRLPWLLLTLVGGLCIAFLVSRFEATLQAVQIAFFIPLIPLMGGNVAIQSSAIVVRGLAVGDIHQGRTMAFMGKQWLVIGLLAFCCGGMAAVVGSFFSHTAARLPLVVGIAIAAAIVVAGTLGTLLPIAFDRCGLDPAVSAGPFVTILNDLLCIAIYLGLGTTLVA